MCTCVLLPDSIVSKSYTDSKCFSNITLCAVTLSLVPVPVCLDFYILNGMLIKYLLTEY